MFDRATIFPLMILLNTAGCGAESSPDATAPEQQTSDAVFDPVVETLDRARAAEDLVLERKNELDQKLKDLETGADRDH